MLLIERRSLHTLPRLAASLDTQNLNLGSLYNQPQCFFKRPLDTVRKKMARSSPDLAIFFADT